MQYIRPTNLEKLSDNTYIYVNRNVLNQTIAEYEMNKNPSDCSEELKILLAIWNKTYKTEKETKRIISFVKMTNKDIKKCFKKYKSLPIGSFGIIQNDLPTI